MRKCYFWAMTQIGEHKKFYRFRSAAERLEWSRSRVGLQAPITFITGTHPEVRRIKRRISQGEQITFPVEVVE